MLVRDIGTLTAMAAAVALASPASASTFWPETAQALTTKELKGFKSVRVRGLRGSYIQIDDQLFPRQQTLLSGFIARPWTNGKLYYSFDANVNAAQRLVFVTSCQLWGEVARVECVARTTQPNYVVVRTSDGNNATVGMPQGAGAINILNWNAPYVVAHEIGHSLGLTHEQCRSDRDQFVEILTQNILPGREGNFAIFATNNVGTAYDFDSVMHYSGTAFGKAGPSGPLMTIRVKPPNQAMQSRIGQRQRLSVTDGRGMAARYGAP